MRVHPSNKASRVLLTGMMLGAFAVRALVPQGFMPASDRPFALEICHEAFPADMLARGEPRHDEAQPLGQPLSHGVAGATAAHHHHSGSPSHVEHCVFGSACSAGPVSHWAVPHDLSFAAQSRAFAFVSPARAIRLVHLPQPRAPPGQLS